MKHNGYFFHCNGKDVFIVTSRTRKTKKLATDFIKAAGEKVTDNAVNWLLYAMQPATLKVKETSSGRKYNDIHSGWFGGYGHFQDENKDIIVVLD